MNRRARVASGIVVGVSIALLLWPDAGDPTPGPRAIGTGQAATSVAPVDDAVGRATTFGAGGTGDGAADSSRVAVRPEGLGVPQIVRLLVLVEDAQPAVRATVRYLPPGGVADRESDDLEVRLCHAGNVLTDERGRVDLVAQRGSDLCVRLDEHYGELDLAAWDESSTAIVTLVLQRDVSLRVRVADLEGRPREGIVVRAALLAVSRTAGEIEAEARTSRTDATGLTTLAHLQSQVPMPGTDFVRWHLRLFCHGMDGPSSARLVTPSELTNREPFVLVVPSGGSVLARVVDADGRPWFGGTHLIDGANGHPYSVHHNDLRDGTHWFRQLPLGGSWRVSCEGREEPGFTSAAFAGPTSPDEVVEVAMTVPERTWSVKGRVVRPDGVPLERTPVACRTRHVVVERPQLRQGRFDFSCRLPAAIETIDDLTLEVFVGEEPTIVRLERVLPSGRTDLGDVVVPMPVDDTLLAAVEVRCDGRVISDTTHVELWTTVSDRARHEVFTVRTMHGTEIELRGHPPNVPMRLRCQHADCRGRMVSIARGERIVIDLERRTDLRVSIRPPSVPRQLIVGALLRDGDPEVGQLDSSNQIIWRTIDPGSHRFCIEVDGVLCYQSPAIDVRAGDNVWPADGTSLDLRDRIRAFHLDIVAADGVGAIDEARVYCVPAQLQSLPEDFQEMALTKPNWFVPRPRAVDLLVAASGFVPVRLQAPAADTVVPLQRRTTLVMHGPADPDAGVTVRIVTHGVTDPPLRALMAEEEPEERHFGGPSTEEWQSAPGTVYEVTVHRNGNAGTPQRVVVGSTSPQVVQVR